MFVGVSAASSSWQQVYDSGLYYLYSMEVHRGKLYVGGGDDSRVYSFDGDNWVLAYDPDGDYVTAMTSYMDNLFIGTSYPGKIYTFNGSQWSLSYDVGPTKYVYAFATYNGKLYAGWGDPAAVYVYDGSWQPSALSLAGTYVRSFAVYENKLYASTEGGYIHVFDGNSWTLAYNSLESDVYSLTVFDNKLYAGTGSRGKIYVYDGSGWSVDFDSPQSQIMSFINYGGELYASAAYNGVIYKRVRDNWIEIFDTVQDEVNAFAQYGAKLYAACGYKGVVFSFTEFDFSLSASPDNLQLGRGESKTSTVTVDLVSGVADNVSLSGNWVLRAPADVTAELDVIMGEPPFTVNVTFTTSATALSGTYTYQVTGTWENVSKSVEIVVGVTAPPIAPVLFSPGNGTVLDDLTPTLDWEDTPGAESYTLELATDNLFTYIIWTTATTESQAETATQLSYGTTYYWRVRAANQYGTGEWSDVWLFHLSATPPKVVSVLLEGGAVFVNSTTVSLSLSVQNTVEVSFSTDGIIWSDWELYENVKSYTLPTGDGEKTVYVRARDNQGNVSVPVSVSVTLDQTPTTTTHSLQGTPGPQGYISSVLIQFKAMDATSGVAATYYRVNGGEWKTGDSVLISESGMHVVEYYSVDLAGNAEEITQIRVQVYVPVEVEVPLYVWTALVAIAAVGLSVTYAWHRGKPARRLREIGAERRELERIKRKAERDYFELGRASRETYDSLIRRYKERMAELEREERLLKRKLKKREG
jgi:hypothetical protein